MLWPTVCEAAAQLQKEISDEIHYVLAIPPELYTDTNTRANMLKVAETHGLTHLHVFEAKYV